MKKIFATLMIACLTAGAWAADMPGQGFGFQIGWAQPILRLNSSSALYPKDSLVNVTKLNGLKVGLVYDVSYIKGFGSTVGINYTFAAGHSNWVTTGITNYPRTRTQTFYQELELFVDWQYKFEVAKETYLMLYTGPTLQCGLIYDERAVTEMQNFSGDIVRTVSSTNRYTRNDADNVLSNNDLTRLNITWGVGAGFQFKKYFIRGGYDFGLINPYANKQFVTLTGSTSDRYTRGRLDQWSIKIGMYIWYED